ncbi:MAG TPA: hypothetical protein VGS58_18690, partial [Candidatus Sulfopaludibacter sp.]|nr:hypothetical protein [Candidatus Sulfopaludibacter sp.]
MRRWFSRLVEHFLARLARGSQDAASSEFELSAGALLGLLAAPGAFQCFLMLDKYSTFLNWFRGRLRQNLYLTSVPDKYEFIALAMAVTGIVTVLKWDRILPDSQDYLNLAPLPVRPRSILLANAAAIVIAVIVFSIDVNGLPVLLFPLFVSSAAQLSTAGFLQFAAAHAASVMLAGLFTFCAVFALLGTLGAVLPRETFRACSSWVRGLLLVAFIVLLLSGFAGASLARDLLMHPESAVRWLPSLWFLGLYQSLQHAGPARLAALAPFALRGLAAAFGLMLLSYALSYRRRFAATLESGRPPSEKRIFSLVAAALDLFAARAAGFPRACHRFVVRAMLRNETHRLCIAVALGLGYLLAFQSASSALSGDAVRDVLPETDLLAAPLIAAYLLILGLRVAFELPASVPANWIFRSILDARENETAGMARQIILGFFTPLVLLPSLALACWRWGLVIGIAQTLYVLAVSLCLIEILLAGYRKVPLTCPMPGFRDNFLMLCLVQLLGFELFTRFGADVE